MFCVRRVVFDGAWCPIGVPHDPADDGVVEVICDRTNCHRLVPNAHINQPNAWKEANIRVSIGTG